MRTRFTLLLAVIAVAPLAADEVLYRDRAKGDRAIKTAKGKIDSESPQSIKIGTTTVSSADVVEVKYDLPGSINLKYPKAVQAEKRDTAAAIKEYEGLLPDLARGTDNASKFIKRNVEYRVALLKSQKADDGKEALQQAIDAVAKFRKDNPDGWQTVAAARLHARLLLDKSPPDRDAARKLYEELAAAPVSADVKTDCQYQIIDLALATGKADDAKAKVAALPGGDGRVALYQAALANDAAKLEALIDKTTDPGVKAAGYNLLGDTLRRDPKKLKDAMYAYLYVDVVFNQDPQEAAKAIDRLADVFRDLKDDERSKLYRARQRGL